MAESLIAAMTDKWQPDNYRDEYREALMELIEEKIAAGGKVVAGTKPAAKPATNVVDLVAVLQQSLAQKEQGKKAKPAPARKKKAA